MLSAYQQQSQTHEDSAENRDEKNDFQSTTDVSEDEERKGHDVENKSQNDVERGIF